MRQGSDQTRAFLRWAGGKGWLTRRRQDLFGELSFRRYHEPFVGGGSFFFSLGATQEAFLSDTNANLIEVYECVKEDHNAVIDVLKSLKNTSNDYYEIRSSKPDCRFTRAAYFIYLNQTSFNGIYRVNLKGAYNVPYGNRQKNFLEEDVLRKVALALRNTNLRSCDFADTLGDVQDGDLVFIDPPYTVSHNNNGFIKYNQSLFSLEDQYRLAEFIRQVRERGASYILTNAAHGKIRDIFDLGDRCLEVSRASLIGGKRAQRGPVAEYLFTNLRGTDGRPG